MHVRYLRVTAAGVTRAITHGASVCAGTIRHERARRAGAPFTRPSDVQTQRRPQSFAGAARRLHKCSRAVSHTPQGGITRVHDLCAPHMARASSSSLSTAVLHSVGARRRRAGRTCREQSARPLRRASEGAGCVICNRRGSCEPRVVEFCPRGVGKLSPLCETLRDCARAPRRAVCRAGAPA